MLHYVLTFSCVVITEFSASSFNAVTQMDETIIYSEQNTKNNPLSLWGLEKKLVVCFGIMAAGEGRGRYEREREGVGKEQEREVKGRKGQGS